MGNAEAVDGMYCQREQKLLDEAQRPAREEKGFASGK